MYEIALITRIDRYSISSVRIIFRKWSIRTSQNFVINFLIGSSTYLQAGGTIRKDPVSLTTMIRIWTKLLLLMARTESLPWPYYSRRNEIATQQHLRLQSIQSRIDYYQSNFVLTRAPSFMLRKSSALPPYQTSNGSNAVSCWPLTAVVSTTTTANPPQKNVTEHIIVGRRP